MKQILFFLFFSLPAFAQISEVEVTFNWEHDGKFTEGFRLYKGGSPLALIKIKDLVGASVRSYQFKGTESLPVCFGISAYGAMGESTITTKRVDGTEMCLGKPIPPTNFSFSVPSNP